jgi:hypothetical protein
MVTVSTSTSAVTATTTVATSQMSSDVLVNINVSAPIMGAGTILDDFRDS